MRPRREKNTTAALLVRALLLLCNNKVLVVQLRAVVVSTCATLALGNPYIKADCRCCCKYLLFSTTERGNATSPQQQQQLLLQRPIKAPDFFLRYGTQKNVFVVVVAVVVFTSSLQKHKHAPVAIVETMPQPFISRGMYGHNCGRIALL